jgi:hypothetical protein
MYLPLPPNPTENSRHNLTENLTNRIVPGKTSLEDLLLQFGDPELISPDEKKLLYGTMWKVGELWFAMGLSGFGIDVHTNEYFIINLNNQNVVTSVQHIDETMSTKIPDDFHFKPPRFPLYSNSGRLYPDVGLPSKTELEQSLVTVKDLALDRKRGWLKPLDRSPVLIPSEPELVRRILVRKLAELQRKYVVESPQKYSAEIIEFNFNYVPFAVEVQISLNIKCASGNFNLNGYSKENISFNAFYSDPAIKNNSRYRHLGVREMMFEPGTENALLKIEQDLESKAPKIFGISD